MSLAVTRRLLLDVLTTDRLSLLLGGLLLNVHLGIVIAAFTFVAILVTALPMIWAYFTPALLIGSEWPAVGVGLTALGLMVPAFFDATDWNKVLAITAIFPCALLLTSGVATLALFPIRSPLRRIGLALLNRAAAHEKAFLAFIATGCVLIVGVVKAVLAVFGY